MSEESAYIPSPYNGITQAAQQVRLTEQAPVLENVMVDLPDGLRKRPPLNFIQKLQVDFALPSAKAWPVRDPDDGSLLFLLSNREEETSTIHHLFNSGGAPVTLLADAGVQDYLDVMGDPKAEERMSTVIDYTILTNRTQVIALNSTPNASRPYEAYVSIKSGAFGKRYEVQIQKAGGSLRTGYVVPPVGDDATDALWVNTDLIARVIFLGDSYTTVNSATSASMSADLITDGFTVAVQGSVAYIAHASTDFTITVKDAQGGTAMVAGKGTIQKFEDLPAVMPASADGFTVKIEPQRGDKLGSYYVKWLADPNPGRWKETFGPASQKGFDPSTMPVGLIKDGSDWTMKILPWVQREVGDETLCVDPLFVGSTIQDIGYAFGRLVIVSPEEVFMAASDDPFRIYPSTLTTTIDSDPISKIPPTKNAQFRSVTPYSSDQLEGAFVTGLAQQCVLRAASADGGVTPDNLKLSRLSNFTLKEATQGIRPLENNGKVYLPVPLSDLYVGLREMQPDRVSGEGMGDDLTPATPKKLPLDLDIAVTCETGYSALYAVSGTSQLYLHIFRYSGQERVQNGLFDWSLPEGWTVADIVADGQVFYLFLIYDDEFYLFSVNTAPKILDDDASSTIHTKWDLRQREDQVTSRTYDAVNDWTTITSKCTLNSGLGYVSSRAGSADDDYPEGYLAEVLSQPTPTTIRVKGDWTGSQKFYVGVSYTGLWTPTKIQKFSTGDTRVMHTSSLTVREIVMDVSQATSLQARITIASRGSRTYELNQNVLGSPTLFDGPWTVPVKGKAHETTIEIMDQGHIGGNISGFEWFGDYNPKARRTT